MTLAGATCNETARADTVKGAVCWDEAVVAVMETLLSAVGFVVVTVNVAVVCPTGMTSVAGTEAVAGRLLVSVTVVSIVTAADNVIVPTAVAEPVSVAGEIVKEAIEPVAGQLLTVTGSDDRGNGFESVATSTKLSPDTPATGIVNPPLLAVDVNVWVEPPFVAVTVIGVSLSASLTVPLGATRLALPVVVGTITI